MFPPPVVQLTQGAIYRSYGNFALTDDQALVVTVQPANAAYTGFTIQNDWTISPSYWNQQTSLNNSQAVPNPDGTYTYVVSIKDPGVYNWISTAGLTQGTFLLRWQQVPTIAAGGVSPSVTSQLVNLSQLKSVLPSGTRWVTPWQRAEQLAEREASFDLRIAPGTPVPGLSQ